MIRGFTLREGGLKVQFFISFIGVNLTFFPIHFLGLIGMPRRYVDYRDYLSGWNILRRLGSYLTFLSVLLFIFLLREAFLRKRFLLGRFFRNSSLERRHRFPPQDHRYISYPCLVFKA